MRTQWDLPLFASFFFVSSLRHGNDPPFTVMHFCFPIQILPSQCDTISNKWEHLYSNLKGKCKENTRMYYLIAKTYNPKKCVEEQWDFQVVDFFTEKRPYPVICTSIPTSTSALRRLWLSWILTFCLRKDIELDVGNSGLGLWRVIEVLVRSKCRFDGDKMLHFEEAISTKGQLAPPIILQYATWNLSGCRFQELVFVPAPVRTEHK